MYLNLLFNYRIVGFDKVVKFEEVTIGRFGPTNQINETPGTGMTTRGAMGCRKVTSYTLEPGAVKFGDSSNTHVQINFRKKSILQRNFTLELDFRTFHPNGLLFMIPVRKRIVLSGVWVYMLNKIYR
jgi:laminin alpha 1/2